ncbi:MAG: preprotein translocase subunit YajC [Muribaculaceae bacterium]|nr:preprotein translocase subunit YajC [Muribaculaceae bacterium]
MLNFILLQQPQGSGFSILMIVALFVIFYFFMIRPQQKRQKEIRKFRESLTTGSEIVTAGGIYGTIRDVKENCFIVEIANGVKIRIDKGSVYPTATDANQANQNEQK